MLLSLAPVGCDHELQPSHTCLELVLQGRLANHGKAAHLFGFSHTGPKGLSSGFGNEAISGASTYAELERVSAGFGEVVEYCGKNAFRSATSACRRVSCGGTGCVISGKQILPLGRRAPLDEAEDSLSMGLARPRSFSGDNKRDR